MMEAPPPVSAINKINDDDTAHSTPRLQVDTTMNTEAPPPLIEVNKLSDYKGHSEDSVDLDLQKQSFAKEVTNESNNNNKDCAHDETTNNEQCVNPRFVGVAYDYGFFPKILSVHSIKPDEMKLIQETPQTMPPLSPQSRLTGGVQPQVWPPQLGPPQFDPRQGPPEFIQRQYRPPQVSPPHFTQFQQYPPETNPPMIRPPQLRHQQPLHLQYRPMMSRGEVERMEHWRRQAAMQEMQAKLEHDRFHRQQQRNMTVSNTATCEAELPAQMQGGPFSHQRNYDQEGHSNQLLSSDLQQRTNPHQGVLQSHPNDLFGYQMSAMSSQFRNRQGNDVHHNNLAVKRTFDTFSPENETAYSPLSPSPKRFRFGNAISTERSTTPVDFPLMKISNPGDRHPQFIPKNNMYQEQMTGVESPYLHESSVPPSLNFEHVLQEEPVRELLLQEYQNFIRMGWRLPQSEYQNYIRLLEQKQQQQQNHPRSENIRNRIAASIMSRIPRNTQEWIPGNRHEWISENRPERLPGTIPNGIPQDMANRIPGHPKQIIPRSISTNIRERMLGDILDLSPRVIQGSIPGNRQVRSPEIKPDDLPRRMQDRIPENAVGEYPTNVPECMPVDMFMDNASVERLMHKGNHQVKNAVEHYNRLKTSMSSRRKSSHSCDKCVESVNRDVCTQKEVDENLADGHESQPLSHCGLKDGNDSRKNLESERVISTNSTKAMPLDFRISNSDLSHLLLIENKRELLLSLEAAAKISQRVLAIVVERLIAKKVLTSALILLDHLKLSDLTEIVKERVLSVVREIVWGDHPRLDLWKEGKKDQGYNDVKEFHNDTNDIQITDIEVDDNEVDENEDRGNEVNENELIENDVNDDIINGNEVSEKELKEDEARITAHVVCEHRNKLLESTEKLQSSNQIFHSFKDDVMKQDEISSPIQKGFEINDIVSEVTISTSDKNNDSITMNNISYEDCWGINTEIIDKGVSPHIDDEIVVNMKKEPNQDKEFSACRYGKETDTVQNYDFEHSGDRERMEKKTNEYDVNWNTDRVEKVVEEQAKTGDAEVHESWNGCKRVSNENCLTLKLEHVDDIIENSDSVNNGVCSEQNFNWTTVVVKQENEFNGNVNGVTPVKNDNLVTKSRTEGDRKNTAIEVDAKEMDRNLNSFGPLENKNCLPESDLETLGNVTICLDASGNIVIKEEDGASKRDHFEIGCKPKLDTNFSIKKEATGENYKLDYESSIVGNVFDLFR